MTTTKGELTWNKCGLDLYTSMAGARLVHFTGVNKGDRVLDVGAGAGSSAIAAARRGGTVTALDLSPELLEVAQQNAEIAGVKFETKQADAHQLPFEANSFDVVISAFGHMVMPDGEGVLREMLRVLKPGGRLGVCTWPPTSPVGEFCRLLERFHRVVGIPLLMNVTSWGKTDFIREQLGEAVTDIQFDIYTIRAPYMSPQHHVRHVVQAGGRHAEEPKLTEEQQRLAKTVTFNMLDTVTPFFDETEHVIRFNCLLTRASKKTA